ncbi:MAG: GFA family protein [Cyanobacteria bacterium]|nr:GFA family protein [Cyanobacteriota bacterium]MDW8202769.1 GFA family protein [Cyanobacteriota bacterium SKYGB_h_bin112]
MKYVGSCHCRAVQFEIEAPATIACVDCNCSMCSKSGFLHLILPKSKFKLIAGEHNLTTYRFNTGIAQHTFCKTCGIKPFYIPRSNPDGIDVNVRCLEPPPVNLVIEPFDGQHWEQHAHTLAHLSQEDDHS